ncbi:helix-turn-helix domain-containing protein [Dyadobacter sandarakinus]|uniref:Helix-turn-helix domain-containing protein n=1 Tax=Dyadobacter sandarakinus TaxID=2747268 RepID=A0ABX7I442_9BACT|nr:helix-turn-helix domain-containing protein [Dyadobacter sandarakinus]QRR00842.1 helix-turn-helix domain-containing protein [Dyadobacter sandarakinus]
MKRYILHAPFSIYHFEADVWEHSVHKHTYFEIIFILNGSGMHHINGHAYEYASDDVFLLGPEDFHHFEIAETTEFCFVRFEESIDKQQFGQSEPAWQPIIKALLNTSSQSRGSIVIDKLEKQKLLHLLATLEAECANERSAYFEIVRDSILRSMLLVLARNLFSQSSSNKVKKASIEAILMHIRQHIFQPEFLTIGHLAVTFNYAPTYVSLFFKRHTGESLKHYIIRYKVRIIESRLLYSNRTLTEIADEFGYTDESHLCKQFRKYTGVSPVSFRNAVAQL